MLGTLRRSLRLLQPVDPVLGAGAAPQRPRDRSAPELVGSPAAAAEGGRAARGHTDSSGRWQCAPAVFDGDPAAPEHGSLESFLTDRRWGFTRDRAGRT